MRQTCAFTAGFVADMCVHYGTLIVAPPTCLGSTFVTAAVFRFSLLPSTLDTSFLLTASDELQTVLRRRRLRSISKRKVCSVRACVCGA